MIKENTNNPGGLDLTLEKASQKPSDYVFGSKSLPSYATKVILQPSGFWGDSLPLIERQQQFGVESMACVPFTTLTICEILILRKYGIYVNFSDRFLAKVGGVTVTGSSPTKVAETLRKVGVPLEREYPFTKNIDSWDKYYAHISSNSELYKLAGEFLKAWNFKHYFVPNNPEAIADALKFSPLGMSVFAWAEEDGIYRQYGQDQHFTTCYASNKFGNYYNIFDSYDAFHKKYSHKTRPAIVKGYYLGQKPLHRNWLIDLWKAMWKGR